MKIAIMSDSHDNFENIRKAVKKIVKEGCEAIIHCGDVASGLALKELAKSNIPLYLSIGNADDVKSIEESVQEHNVKIFKNFGMIELDYHIIGFTHFPEIAEKKAEISNLDIIFYGHTHKKKKEIINNTWIVNPGETVGIKGKPSIAFFDTKNEQIEFFDLQ